MANHNEQVRARWGFIGTVALVLGWGSAAGAQTTAPPSIKVHLTLNEHRVVSGHPIEGTVVLTNSADHEITVNTCATNGWLAVSLRGHGIPPSFFHSAVACAPSVRLTPGAHRFPVRVTTTYDTCEQSVPAGSTASSFPICTVSDGHVGPPPLPAGKYSTTMQIVGLDGDTGTPNRVVVTLSAPATPPKLAPCADAPGAPIPTVTVPNVVGMSSSLAALSFAHACLDAGYASPVGTHVAAESPAAGSKVAEHSTVILTTQGTDGTAP